MLIRKGRLINSLYEKYPTLESPSGQKVQVRFLSAYIWNLLDGKRSIESIKKRIEFVSEKQPQVLEQKILEIIEDLKKCDLIEVYEEQYNL